MMRWRTLCAAALLSVAAASTEAKTLRMGLTGLPVAKGNPYATTATTPFTFFTALFDPLTMIDDQGKLHPWLALEWKPQNETTWRFKLRPGVTFSNGEPFDAAAVKTAFDFLLSPAAAAQTVGRDIDFIAGVNVIDALTVEIVTKTPNIFLPRYVAGVNIVAPKQFTALGVDGFAQAPVGTGPFKVENWGAEKVLLAKFAGSWRAPRVDKLEMLALPDGVTRIQAMETGRVDVATNINPEDVAVLEAMGGRVHRRNPTRILVITLDTLKEGSPFKDTRVRQAMNYGINRQAITTSLLSGLIEPASQPAPATSIGYVPGLKPYPYDPDKARQLLKEAGYANGFSFVMEFPGGQLANDRAVAQQMAADLSLIGVRMEVREIPLPQLVRNMIQGGWKGLALITDFSTAPSLDMLRAFNRHSCGWSAPWVCEKAIEPTLEEAARTFDEGKRIKLTQDAVRYYRDQALGVFLYPVLSLDGVSARVTRWEPWNDNFMYHLADVKDEK